MNILSGNEITASANPVRFEEALKACVAGLGRTKPKPVARFTFGGRPYVVKFRRRAATRYVRSWLVSAACAMLADHLDDDVAAGRLLLQRYFQRAPSEAVKALLRRVSRLAGWLAGAERWLGKLRAKNDVRRAFFTMRVLRLP